MLQELTDRAAIVDAVIAYATALDTRDWAALGALFTDDARWEYSGSEERLHGPDAIVTRIRTSLERIDATQHLNGNHVAAVHGDEAEHTCYYQAQHVRHGLPDGGKFVKDASAPCWAAGLRLPPERLPEGVPRGGGEQEDGAVQLLGVPDGDGVGDVAGDLDALTGRRAVAGLTEAEHLHLLISFAMLSMNWTES
ncbi:nuclear transport factor 2 family protein [Streptomyces sp. SID11233]|nr:nuclear transport factor 2 family protein [Streptomyces sp. SID11233]